MYVPCRGMSEGGPVRLLHDWAVKLPAPVWSNTCYSLIAPGYGISVAGVYRLVDGKIAEVKGAGGVSPREADASFREREAEYGRGWYRAVTRDTWGTVHPS